MPSYLDGDPTRKTGWRYQRAVPKDLRPLLGKARFVKHIPSMSRREAEKIAAAYSLKDDQLIRALRNASDQERALILAHGNLGSLHASAPVMEDAYRHMKLLTDQMHVVDTAKIAAGINASGLVDRPASPGDIAHALLEAKAYTTSLEPQLAAVRQVLRRTADKPLGTTLADLLALWERVKQPKHTRKHHASVRLFEAFIGDDIDARTITQAHIAAFRDHQEALGMKAGVQDNHLKKLRAIFAVAVSERKITANPASGIHVRKARQRHVVDHDNYYTGAQVRAILEKAEATKFGGKNQHADALWALRLAFYTGARIGEICQLRKADVVVKDGVPVLIFHEGAEGQSIKNPNSARVVPLHPTVGGFLDYAANARGPWVFGFKHYRDSGRAGWLIQRFSKFRRDVCGITTKVTLHKARHRFIDAMRDAGVPEDRRKAIVGHAGNGIHAEYGRGPGLKALAAEMARVDPLA